MCADSFERWFKDILPQLEENVIIVLDNAPYHSHKKEKIPNANCNKPEIRAWLKSTNIDFEDNDVEKRIT